MFPPLITRGAIGASLLSAPIAIVSCGSRGPLETNLVAGPDAGDDSNAEASSADRTGDAGGDGTDGADGAGAEAGLVDCVECIGTKCGNAIVTCFASATCGPALECTISVCLPHGVPDLGCIDTCTKDNQQTLQELNVIYTCVETACGLQCASAVAGM